MVDSPDPRATPGDLSLDNNNDNNHCENQQDIRNQQPARRPPVPWPAGSRRSDTRPVRYQTLQTLTSPAGVSIRGSTSTQRQRTNAIQHFMAASSQADFIPQHPTTPVERRTSLNIDKPKIVRERGAHSRSLLRDSNGRFLRRPKQDTPHHPRPTPIEQPTVQPDRRPGAVGVIEYPGNPSGHGGSHFYQHSQMPPPSNTSAQTWPEIDVESMVSASFQPQESTSSVPFQPQESSFSVTVQPQDFWLLGECIGIFGPYSVCITVERQVVENNLARQFSEQDLLGLTGPEIPLTPGPKAYGSKWIFADGYDVLNKSVIDRVLRQCWSRGYRASVRAIITWHQLAVAEDLFDFGIWRQKFMVSYDKVFEFDHQPNPVLGTRRKHTMLYLLKESSDHGGFAWFKVIPNGGLIYSGKTPLPPIEFEGVLNLMQFFFARVDCRRTSEEYAKLVAGMLIDNNPEVDAENARIARCNIPGRPSGRKGFHKATDTDIFRAELSTIPKALTVLDLGRRAAVAAAGQGQLARVNPVAGMVANPGMSGDNTAPAAANIVQHTPTAAPVPETPAEAAAGSAATDIQANPAQPDLLEAPAMTAAAADTIPDPNASNAPAATNAAQHATGLEIPAVANTVQQPTAFENPVAATNLNNTVEGPNAWNAPATANPVQHATSLEDPSAVNTFMIDFEDPTAPNPDDALEDPNAWIAPAAHYATTTSDFLGVEEAPLEPYFQAVADAGNTGIPGIWQPYMDDPIAWEPPSTSYAAYAPEDLDSGVVNGEPPVSEFFELALLPKDYEEFTNFPEADLDLEDLHSPSDPELPWIPSLSRVPPIPDEQDDFPDPMDIDNTEGDIGAILADEFINNAALDDGDQGNTDDLVKDKSSD